MCNLDQTVLGLLHKSKLNHLLPARLLSNMNFGVLKFVLWFIYRNRFTIIMTKQANFCEKEQIQPCFNFVSALLLFECLVCFQFSSFRNNVHNWKSRMSSYHSLTRHLRGTRSSCQTCRQRPTSRQVSALVLSHPCKSLDCQKRINQKVQTKK